MALGGLVVARALAARTRGREAVEPHACCSSGSPWWLPLVVVLVMNLGRDPHVIGSPLVGRPAPAVHAASARRAASPSRSRACAAARWSSTSGPPGACPASRSTRLLVSSRAQPGRPRALRRCHLRGRARSRCATSWRGRARPTRRSSIPAAARRSPSASSACPRRTSSTPKGRSSPSTSGRSTRRRSSAEAAPGGARAVKRLRAGSRASSLRLRAARGRAGRARPGSEPSRVVGAPRGTRARGRCARRAHRRGGRPAALPGVPGPLGGRLARHDGRQHEGAR